MRPVAAGDGRRPSRRIAAIASPDRHPAGTDAAELPWPGDELVSRVAAGTDREAFYESGRQSVRDLAAALATLGRGLADYGDVLDFGCGCGRILLWLEDAAAATRLHGCDVDARAIRWAAGNLPWARFTVNGTVPPLDYADCSFDLVYNHSVFTHLDEHHQDLWLAELWRVTRPGGHLVLTVHGERPLAVFEEASRGAGGDPGYLRRQRDDEGIAFVARDAFTGGPHAGGYHSSFHAPWYVFEHWSRFFEVRGYLPARSLGYQDVVLLERRAGDTAVPRPAAVARPRRAPAAEPAGPAVTARAEVARAATRPLDGPGVDAPARYGAGSRLARRAALRLLDNYASYQRGVDEDVRAALAALDRDLSELASQLEDLRAAVRVDGVLTLQESNARLWDALARQGERVNRLEADLWSAVDGHPPTA